MGRSAINTLCGIAFLLAALSPLQAARAADAPTLAARDDASLNDVCFVDPQHGWAVGDRGVIWHTSDAGARWERQESGITCRLASVQFADANHGWVAGGATEPFSQVSRGVLLRTRDGGRTWTAIPQPLIGEVLQMKLLDAKRGWIICVPNGLCPGNVLSTDNGGLDWKPLAQQSTHVWSCGDSLDLQRGALAADGGATGLIERGELRPRGFEGGGLPRHTGLRLTPTGEGFLIGEWGRLATTRDGGRSWQWRDLPETSRGTELRALELRDNDVWIAGNPGAEMLHSADRGQTWQAVPTGTTLPISAIQFADARHGWAVGALGQILATTDGGRTWKPQRGERRAALLAVFSDADDVPLEALARFSAGEGYRSVVSLVTRRDLEAGATPPLVVRLREREALLLAGASDVSMGWQQPLMLALDQSAAGKKVDWRQATMDQDRFMPRLEWRLMSDIRCWRPDVIVTQSVEDRDNKPEAQLIHKALLKAVQQAANDNYKTSLPPWQVKRVVAMLGAQRRGTLSLASSQILPQLGHSLSEHVAPARGLLARFAVPTTESTAYNVAWDEGGRDAPLRDFFSGLNVRPGSDARRAPVMEQATSLDEMRRMAQRRQALQAIVAHKSPEQTNRAAWLAQIGTLTRDLDNASAALLLYQLGCRYQASGQWDLAAETFSQVAEKYPGQSGVTAVSALWLLQYYASGELTVRADREGRVQLAKAEQPETAPRGTAALIPVTEDDRAASRKPPSTPPRDEQPPAVGSGAARRQSAITWAQRLETISTQLAAEPCAVLPAARALAAVDDGKSQRLLMGLRRARGLDAGASGAAAESWLGGRTRGANAPKAVWLCRRTAEKPRLDGRLDDACWHGQEEAVELPGVELRSPRRDDEAWPALVQVAYDQEFLYLAATCRKAPCVEYAAAAGPRQRDAELAAHDRIALMLDIDRDWTSYWRLAVDCRGQTAEDCWGDRTWNPNWYVAAGQQANSWTFEAAIPWSELTSRPPQPRETWAVGVERAVPGVGFQSWTTPASAEAVRPEGFGLLIFQ